MGIVNLQLAQMFVNNVNTLENNVMLNDIRFVLSVDNGQVVSIWFPEPTNNTKPLVLLCTSNYLYSRYT